MGEGRGVNNNLFCFVHIQENLPPSPQNDKDTQDYRGEVDGPERQDGPGSLASEERRAQNTAGLTASAAMILVLL